jgi:hypothetical protein
MDLGLRRRLPVVGAGGLVGGENSTGEMGKFQSALTKLACLVCQKARRLLAKRNACTRTARSGFSTAGRGEAVSPAPQEH